MLALVRPMVRFGPLARKIASNKIFGTHATYSQRVVSSEIIDAFRETVGSNNVSTALAVREHHGKDESTFPIGAADVVIFPESTEQVSKCAQVCYQNDIPIIPFGTGTGLEGGVTATHGGVCFDLSKMAEVESVHAEDFDVTVQSGVTRLALNSYLRDTGLWFPIDPGADASLCGMCATSASGTNAVQYGTMRENVLNLEVVLADGTVIDTAGKNRRTKKTSAGYNLTNLFVGSEGTLGIITKATLRLYGIPEAMAAAVCQFPSVQEAVDTTVMVLQSGVPVARVEFLDDLMMRACNSFSNLSYKELPTLFFEFHGSEKYVDDQAETVGEIVALNGGSEFMWAKDEDERRKLWTARHNAFYASIALRPGCQIITTDVCVPISALPEVVTATKEDILQSGFIAPMVGHVGDGNFHCLVAVDTSNPGEMKQSKEFAARLAERALAVNGTCTGEHGIGLGKRQFLVKEIGEAGIAVMKQIKMALDPKNIMNPGKVLN